MVCFAGMIAQTLTVGRYARSLLILGRVSNLPTVWSNCLAGWWLGGSGEWHRFFMVCLGGTFLYLAGMYLNDAFDAQFDQQRRPERPIPSGAIKADAVWQWGFSWLGLGLLSFGLLGWTTAILACLLAACIFVYDVIHKIFAFSPVLMAICRVLLVLAAAAATEGGITGLSIWSALVLGAYIVGLSFLARGETSRGPVRYWPCLFLAAPVVLALIVNRGEFQWRGFALLVLLIVWVLYCLRHTFWSAHRSVGRSVAGLLAGIVLVDLLAVGGSDLLLMPIFLLLFLAAMLLQRFIPAT